MLTHQIDFDSIFVRTNGMAFALSILTEIGVDRLSTCFESAEKAVTISLDEHLDIILRIRKILEDSTSLCANVNNNIEECFNILNEDNSKQLITEINHCISSGNRIIATVKNSPHSIVDGTKTARLEFYHEMQQLIEFRDDIVKFKTNSPDELQKFFMI